MRGRAVAYDADGKKIAEFKGNGSVLHQRNFVDAVRAGDRSLLNTEVEVGHHSTGWCNLANIAARVGGTFDRKIAAQIDDPVWSEAVDEIDAHLQVYNSGLDRDEFAGSSLLQYDEKSGTFTGDSANEANRYLKREYRSGFEVPELS